jgi:uncharacterized protein YndB with AHSA1/START domain
MKPDTATRDNVLRLERLIAATPDKVFDAWVEPELLVKWFGPEGYDIPANTLDVRLGGRWRTTMRSRDGKLHTVSGVYRVIDRPRRLVFTWGWDQEDGSRGHETEVTVTFEPTPGGTRLKLQQQTFQEKEHRDKHGQGWTSSFDCLARLFA